MCVLDLDSTLLEADHCPASTGQIGGDDGHAVRVLRAQHGHQYECGLVGRGVNRMFYVLRPGVREFLREVSKRYVICLCTMGVRPYVSSFLRVLDPERKHLDAYMIVREDFGPGVVDDNGDAVVRKSVKRFFGAVSEQVVVVDDTPDVWPADDGRDRLLDAYRFDPLDKFDRPKWASAREYSLVSKDNVLESLARRLAAVHEAYYRLHDSAHKTGYFPTTRDVVSSERASVLAGVEVAVVSAAGCSEEGSGRARRMALNMGAKVVSAVSPSTNYVVVPVASSVDDALSCPAVDDAVSALWLYNCFYHGARTDHQEFNVDFPTGSASYVDQTLTPGAWREAADRMWADLERRRANRTLPSLRPAVPPEAKKRAATGVVKTAPPSPPGLSVFPRPPTEHVAPDRPTKRTRLEFNPLPVAIEAC